MSMRNETWQDRLKELEKNLENKVMNGEITKEEANEQYLKSYTEEYCNAHPFCDGGMSMGVYIKGMEMPDKCGHCRFATAFECEVTKNFITTFNVRQADCPLVPVAPHGRLIIEEGEIIAEKYQVRKCTGSS
jgi:hypothetical protein